MTMSIARGKLTCFNIRSRPRVVARIGILGAGDVVRRKYAPALRAGDFDLDGIAVCGLETASPLGQDLPHLYFALAADGVPPLDRLHEAGFLSPDTLWIIATPSHCHVRNALMLAGLCRVAIEKPVAADSLDARRLLPLAATGRDIHPIDHKLFNASALAFVGMCRQDPSLLERVRRIEARFYESAGIAAGRTQEDCIADMQWHLFVPLVAIFNSLPVPFEITADSALVSRHQPDPQGTCQTPDVWTASRIQGRLLYGSRTVDYDLCQAKAAPCNEKLLRLYDQRDALVAEIDLNESGWQAHARVLHALMQPCVDMRHTLEDALQVMQLIDACRGMASEAESYSFGRMPDFLANVTR